MLSRPVSSPTVLQAASRLAPALAPLAPNLLGLARAAGRNQVAAHWSPARACATQTPKTTTAEEQGTSAKDSSNFKQKPFQNLPSDRVTALLCALGGGALVASACVKAVPAGHAGVEDRFGTVSSQLRTCGLHIKNPFAQIHAMSLKTTKADFTCSVPSQEGLMVELKITLQYRLDPDCVISLYKEVGLDFQDVLITPQVHAAMRSATSCRDAKALYTTEREQIRLHLLESLNKTLNPRGIIVEDAPLRSIVLPSKLTEAIESKLKMEQESQRMEFVLLKERQEADRKAIEAKGIADFQNIVSQGIDDKLLRWKGIEATVELAQSPNAKVVVVGSASDGLPLILGGK